VFSQTDNSAVDSQSQCLTVSQYKIQIVVFTFFFGGGSSYVVVIFTNGNRLLKLSRIVCYNTVLKMLN
jgi:hypothetical protein